MIRSVLVVVLYYFLPCFCKFTDDNTFYWRRSADIKCEPFSTFMLACNRCVCGADGVSYCTRVYCKNESDVLAKIEFASEIAQRRMEADRYIF